jgi:hypothetical protein
MHESQPQSDLTTRHGSRWELRTLFLLPSPECLMRTLMIINSAKQGDSLPQMGSASVGACDAWDAAG